MEISIDVLLNLFLYLLKDIHVLDAGCGTGNYSKALINHGVRRITLLDSSDKMLSVAKEKLKDAIDKKIIDSVITAVLPNLPFRNSFFDAVMFNAVSSLICFNLRHVVLFTETF